MEVPPGMKVPLVERATLKTSYSEKRSIFHKIKLLHKIEVFCKTRYSVKSSYSDIMHVLCSASILQSPIFIVFKMMTSLNSTKLLIDSNFNKMIEISIINCLYIENDRNQHYKLPLHTKLKLQTLLHHQDISDFMFSLSSK